MAIYVLNDETYLLNMIMAWNIYELFIHLKPTRDNNVIKYNNKAEITVLNVKIIK